MYMYIQYTIPNQVYTDGALTCPSYHLCSSHHGICHVACTHPETTIM